MAKMKFNPKDTKYKTLPKSASPKSPNEPDEYADHSYDHRETRPDGSVVYYYENGVKAIHHPKKTGASYHRRASKHHEKEATNAINAKDSSKALSHLKARLGHLMEADKKEDSKVEKLYKDFGGATSGAGDIVAVSSDPGIFTETYSGTKSKKKKKKLSEKEKIKENEKKKKKASGPDKLDKWLQETQEKTLDLIKYINLQKKAPPKVITKDKPANMGVGIQQPVVTGAGTMKSKDKPKFDLGRTGGLTPDDSVKTSLEERDMESFMEARERNAEDRAFGLKKTDQLSQYVVSLINDVRKELKKEDGMTDMQRRYKKDIETMDALNQDIFDNPDKYGIKFTTQSTQEVQKMETDWSKDKKDGKLNNMPFLGNYKKSLEKQYGTKISPRPDPNGYRNPPNRRVPKD